jgi:hypothetical protein
LRFPDLLFLRAQRCAKTGRRKTKSLLLIEFWARWKSVRYDVPTVTGE